MTAALDTAALLDQAARAFAASSLPAALQQEARYHLRRWAEDPAFLAWRPQLLALAAAGRYALLLDCFYQVLPFGTGGRRGPVGLGPNRFNPWTLGASVQGHATWLRRERGEGPLTVVLGYDVREFRDLRGQMDPDAPNPVLGLRSRDFAEIAAEVYAAAGIRVVLPSRERFLSTPELSFAIRALRADAGLMISASHNHPDDNGGKFYDGEGGQEIPPRDEQMAREVEAVQAIERMPLDRARAAGLVVELPAEVQEDYLRANLACGRGGPAPRGRVVFTGLHGLGRQTAGEVLARAGFEVLREPSQDAYDGAFPGVPFRAPNPEVPASMEAACATADRWGADLVMACDPDADRLGVMVRHPLGREGRWIFLSGNEIAALACAEVLRRREKERPLVVQTEVTSQLVGRVARARGARVIDHLLVGFKYIGAVLHDLETKGAHAGQPGRLEDFVLGAEESHGLLLSPAVRDKDAAGGALVLAELAERERARGRSLFDALLELWREVGYVGNQLRSVVMLGAEGKARIGALMESLRASPPVEIGGLAVSEVLDRQDPTGVFGPILSETDRASRNVLVFRLGAAGRLILRPSGTEPKAKVYVELLGRPGADPLEERARVDAQVQAMGEAFLSLALERVGLPTPPWALRASDLLSIEQKRELVGLVEELRPRLVDPAAAGAWLRTRTAPLGRDGLRLVEPALRAVAEEEGLAGLDAALAAAR